MAAGPAAPAARIGGLRKRYGDKVALDGVGLEVGPGEIRGLLGANGAGKTTLLRVLFGLVQPDAGSLELLGERVTGARRVPLRGVAGFVEEPAFYAYLTGRANLEVLAALDDDVAGPAAIDDALERVGLAGRADDRVGTYSTGLRQRLGVAAALLRQPRLLLLDEPTSGLDPLGTRAVGALLRQLSEQGVAVIVSSHLIGELEALCHSYTILREGRVVWDGTAAELARAAPGPVYRFTTTDDARALEIASGRPGLEATRALSGAGIRLTAELPAVDDYVRAVVGTGLAVRGLELQMGALESVFMKLTTDDKELP
jgi:ABC-2 type transport system ATP-binding protein